MERMGILRKGILASNILKDRISLERCLEVAKVLSLFRVGKKESVSTNTYVD